MKNYGQLEQRVRELIAEAKMAEKPEFIDLSQGFGEAAEELTNPKEAIPVNGWEKFNQATGGLRPKEFTILCGTSGTGKTTWCANLSANLLVGGVPQFVASVETGHTDYVLRVMSAMDQFDYNTGAKYQMDQVTGFMKRYGPIMRSKGLYLAPYANRVEPMRMLCDLLYAHEELGCKVAILDNLNFFLPIVGAESANLSMDHVIHDFIVFVKHIPMHVVMIMHPRKLHPSSEGRADQLDDLKGSSNAPQEAHNVLFLNRPKKSDSDLGYDIRLHRDLTFAKLRRRGAYVHRRIMYQNVASSYVEKELL